MSTCTTEAKLKLKGSLHAASQLPPGDLERVDNFLSMLRVSSCSYLLVYHVSGTPIAAKHKKWSNVDNKSDETTVCQSAKINCFHDDTVVVRQGQRLDCWKGQSGV